MVLFEKFFLQAVHPHQGLEKVNFSPFCLPVIPSRRAAAIVHIRRLTCEMNSSDHAYNMKMTSGSKSLSKLFYLS
jgi:hypothetical protein